MKTTLAFLFVLLWGGPAVAQDLPPEILADKYLLEANKAMEGGNPQRALQMFRKIEALATEKPPEFAYFYGKLLVENSTRLADLRKGHTLLETVCSGYRTGVRALSPDLRTADCERRRN